MCRHGGPVLETREGAAGDPPEAAEEGGKYRPPPGPRLALGGRRQWPSDALFAQAAERWLPRAQEEPWPAEEDRLEDSLEDLGAAGGCLRGPGWVGAQRRLWANLPSARVLPSQQVTF